MGLAAALTGQAGKFSFPVSVAESPVVLLPSVFQAALNALTRLLAGELRAYRILVNTICPGWTDTDMGPGGRPVSEGAGSVMWGALLPDDGPTGGFYRDGRALPW